MLSSAFLDFDQLVALQSAYANLLFYSVAFELHFPTCSLTLGDVVFFGTCMFHDFIRPAVQTLPSRAGLESLYGKRSEQIKQPSASLCSLFYLMKLKFNFYFISW